MKISDTANHAQFNADTHPRRPHRHQVLWGVYCDWEASRDQQSWHVVVNLRSEVEA